MSLEVIAAGLLVASFGLIGTASAEAGHGCGCGSGYGSYQKGGYMEPARTPGGYRQYSYEPGGAVYRSRPSRSRSTPAYLLPKAVRF